MKALDTRAGAVAVAVVWQQVWVSQSGQGQEEQGGSVDKERRRRRGAHAEQQGGLVEGTVALQYTADGTSRVRVLFIFF